MTFLPKPKVRHPSLPKNSLGLTRRDYEGGLSTLCAGCGHDSITAAIIEASWGIDIAVVAYGSSDGAVREALDILARHGIKTNYMRLRSFPFGEEVEKFLEQQKLVFVIEQNRDAQMRSLLTLETRVPKEKLRSLLHYSGLPISSEFIVKGVLAEIEPKTRKLEAIPGKSGVA